MLNHCLGATDDILLPSAADGIDFEGESGIITNDVPMATPAADALPHVRPIVQINGWSLRAIAPIEMKTGFGWIGAKAACSIAPIVVTPDEVGARLAGRADRRPARRGTERRALRRGAVAGHAIRISRAHRPFRAHPRSLCAGTIIGSGTVSSPAYAETGSCGLAERRAIEAIERGAPQTPFLRFGDRVRMEAVIGETRPFGTIDQRVVASG
ncbi:fumarylacetoacetate hydrolase family protein [Allosphingosinicella deserti]|uniref:Fumarylacetoacetase-like C-terminal domain-containing protein n=1 Tax=Allosphingosinicella deserti TaxID=2116704 RepID=A0A2P7QVQ8_9SPHN|nr:fumarylacetoacetate hydrolase family protein [Sphingomonas deserti]PSJ42033.1 hypothetical protein C7I55_07220 [Sphingomonas deserti]